MKRARSLRGWTLDQLATTMAGNAKEATGKSFLSNIEKGKRDISATTVGKLIRALSLDEGWIDRFLDADIAPEAEETREDRATERLLRLYERDDTAPDTGETLLLMLAGQWAQTKFTDPQVAYTALRGALQAADDLRRQGNLPSNTSDQVQAVLRRVADLNDQGRLDDAGAALQDAMDRNAAEAETLFEAALKQDRLRNDPASAARRLVARLKASAPPGGVLNATQRLMNETRERGERMGDPFDLTVALDLARMNLDRAKGPQQAPALNDLGNCHRALGERQSGGGHLTRARNAYARALSLTPRRGDPLNWAVFQDNLGAALQALGDRSADPALLQQAIDAHRAALTVSTPEDTPVDWATSQNNLGNALEGLGDRTADPSLLQKAIDAHRAALTCRMPEDAPTDWATSQNNLGVALQSYGEHTGDPIPLQQSVDAYRAALTVRTAQDTPMYWTDTQNNLGLALRWLGSLTGDAAKLDEAAAAFAECLTVRSRDAVPFNWAQTQWNLADLALARHALSPDPAYLATARHHLALAREVFAEEENAHQLAECDRLQALIDVGQVADSAKG